MLFLTFMLIVTLTILLIVLWYRHRQLSAKVESLKKELNDLRFIVKAMREILAASPKEEKEELAKGLTPQLAKDPSDAKVEKETLPVASDPTEKKKPSQIETPDQSDEKTFLTPSLGIEEKTPDLAATSAGSEETLPQQKVAAISKPGFSKPSAAKKGTVPVASETPEEREPSLIRTSKEKSSLAPPRSTEKIALVLAATSENEEILPQQELAATSKPKAPKSSIDWELLIGGKWLNRIGALALFFSLAFFLKYAFDQNWLNEVVRINLGGVTGLALLYGGYRTNRNKLSIFAQGLVGAGIAILYVTVYASFNFYHLIPQSFALLLMSGITILSFHQAMNYNSLAVALLGWMGGFLTPFLVSTGEASTIGLFTYLSFLVIGILLLLIRRDQWIILYPLSMITTYLIYGAWFLLHYQTELFFLGTFFLPLFWGMFLFFDLSGIVRQIMSYPILRRIFCGMNAAFFSLYLTALIRSVFPVWDGVTTLTIGALYLIMAQVLRKRTAAQPMTIQQYTLTAILFATVATIQEFSGDTLTIIFALEAIVLTWYGIRAQSRYLWITALGIFGITLVQLNIQVSIGALVGEPVIPIWNMQTLAFYTLAICLGVAAFLFQHSTGISRYIPKSLQLAAIVVLILWTILEFSGFTLTILLALAALALIFYGLQSQGRHLWGAGLSLFGITILQLWIRIGIRSLSGEPVAPIWNMQTLAFFILVGSLVVAALLFQRSAQSFTFIPKGLHLGSALLFFQWSTLEYSGYALTLILSLHASLLIWSGRRTQGSYLWITGLGLLGITILQLFITLALQSISEAPQNPVWNMRSLAFFTLTASLLISSLQFRRLGTSGAPIIHKTLQFVWIFLILLWSILEFSGFSLSLLFALQALALIWYGIRLQSRSLWITALSLFGISVPHLLVQTAMVWVLPQESFVPLWNIKSLAYVIVISSLILTIFLFRRLSKPSIKIVQNILHLGWTMLLYSWCTVEIQLSFYSLALGTNGDQLMHFNYISLFATTCLWLLCSIPLLWFGLKHHNKILFFVGCGGYFLAVALSALWSLSLPPIALFTPILNLRFLVMLLIAIGAFMLGRWLKGTQFIKNVKLWSMILHLGISLLLFELISVEIRDGFAKALFLLNSNGGEEALRIENMKQLTISLAWILYSFILMVIGIWRKIKATRILAFSLFGLSILKIFIFDLAFLDTLYRIFSFMVLGFILLGVSYVYGKYRAWFRISKE